MENSSSIKNIIIIGCGSFGQETAWIIERINSKKKEWNILGFVDENTLYHSKKVYSYEVLGNIEELKKYDNIYTVCAIADSKAKEKITAKVSSFPNVKFATIIDPTCLRHESAKIGEGSIICCNTMLNIKTVIGNHVTLVDRSAVGHDSYIGDYSVLFIGAIVAGCTVVGEKCEIGMGAQILQNLSVGKNTTVGAGAVVCKDLPENCKALGIPAKPVE